MLSDLGVVEGQVPEDSEKRRKAARVGAKRRLAVLDKEHPEHDFDDIESEAAALLLELFAYGPLTEAMDDPAVTEMLIRGPHQVWVDRGHGRERLPAGFSGPEAVAMALRRLAGPSFRWNRGKPWLDLHLADGTHIRGAHASVAPGGPVVVIQRPTRAGVGGLVDVVAEAMLPPALAELLIAVARARGSVLVCLGEGCDGAPLMSAIGHELGNIDASRLAVIRTGGRIAPPNGAMVFDVEPGMGAASVRLAIDAGAGRLLVHRGRGAGMASLWSGFQDGLSQLVLSVQASDAAAARAVCVEGLALGGFGSHRDGLARLVASAFDLVLTLSPRPGGGEAVISVAEFDNHGTPRLLLSRPNTESVWRHHADPACVAEMGRRGVTFDPARLTALAKA